MGLEKISVNKKENPKNKLGNVVRSLVAGAMLLGSANLAQAESENTDSVKSPTEITATTTETEEKNEDKLEINEKEWKELLDIYNLEGGEKVTDRIKEIAKERGLAIGESQTMTSNVFQRLFEHFKNIVELQKEKIRNTKDFLNITKDELEKEGKKTFFGGQ